MKKLCFLAVLLCATSLFGQSTILDNLDEQIFLTCGNCGNTNSAGATATYNAVAQTEASRDGKAVAFFISALNKPYANGYFYQKRLGTVAATNFEYEFDLMIPAQYIAAPQAIEFECQDNLAGTTYNFAWQALFTGSKTWRYFDKVNRRWIDAKIPVSLAPDVWHHIKAEFSRSQATTTHVALVVDGVRYLVNVMQPALYAGGKDYMSNAFQLDSNKFGTPYTAFVDKMTLKYW